MHPTKNTYFLPLPADTDISMIVTDGPGHPDPYEGAIDFAVKPGTDVLAPLDGEVMTVVDGHDEYGDDPKYANFANYVQVAHANGETSDLMHLACGSVLVKVGDKVREGQKVAETGLSGYMTAPHLHWAVWVRDNSKNGFRCLRIKTQDSKFYEAELIGARLLGGGNAQ